MKYNSNIPVFFLSVVFVVFLFSACRKPKDDIANDKLSILPSSFKIDIPDCISYPSTTQNTNNTDTDTILDGNYIYGPLGVYINLCELAADEVVGILKTLSLYDINRSMALSYTSKEDGRVKTMIIVANSVYDNITWEFQLSLYDAASSSDGGLALQLFWNRVPLKGIALLKPYNINRSNEIFEKWGQAMFQIEYSEAGDKGYDACMTISVNILSPITDKDAISTMKLFAGKAGNFLDVYGNTEHPELYFLSERKGYNRAFVVCASNSNMAVAEVALPLTTVNSSSRDVLLGTWSVYNVFREELGLFLGHSPDEQTISKYLHNTQPPGYFNVAGFVQAGTSPDDTYGRLQSRISTLCPFNPNDIKSLQIVFKK